MLPLLVGVAPSPMSSFNEVKITLIWTLMRNKLEMWNSAKSASSPVGFLVAEFAKWNVTIMRVKREMRARIVLPVFTGGCCFVLRNVCAFLPVADARRIGACFG